jgi:hypothetical protein
MEDRGVLDGRNHEAASDQKPVSACFNSSGLPIPEKNFCLMDSSALWRGISVAGVFLHSNHRLAAESIDLGLVGATQGATVGAVSLMAGLQTGAPTPQSITVLSLFSCLSRISAPRLWPSNI